jgi:hypothetical protein
MNTGYKPWHGIFQSDISTVSASLHMYTPSHMEPQLALYRPVILSLEKAELFLYTVAGLGDGEFEGLARLGWWTLKRRGHSCNHSINVPDETKDNTGRISISTMWCVQRREPLPNAKAAAFVLLHVKNTRAGSFLGRLLRKSEEISARKCGEITEELLTRGLGYISPVFNTSTADFYS